MKTTHDDECARFTRPDASRRVHKGKEGVYVDVYAFAYAYTYAYVYVYMYAYVYVLA